MATQFDPSSYKAWHAWSLSNFEITSYYEKTKEFIPAPALTAYVVPAVKGFFRSLALSRGNSLQDTLRLLTLWFKFGYQQEVSTAISEGLSSVSIDTWLQVIPQVLLNDFFSAKRASLSLVFMRRALRSGSSFSNCCQTSDGSIPRL